MASDAKIGLLLGLVFIFAIAFLINGLPSFYEDRNNNELTTNMVGLEDNPPGLGAREYKVSRQIINQRKWGKKQPLNELQTPSTGTGDIRFETALPKRTSAVKGIVEVKPVAAVQPLGAVGKKEVRKAKSNESSLPRMYVVNEGDSLAIIAKKLYGRENGNKRINITKIFEANRRLLKSEDEIYVAQKLTIPPLLKKSRRAKQSSRYVVREGDSLWQIAAEQLGQGSRYTEIAKLNADIIDDEDNLAVGMRLKLPVR